MSKKRHGFGWWLFIGWWWYPVKWIYYSIPAFIIRKIYKAITAPKSTPKSDTANPSTNITPASPSCSAKNELYVYVTLKGKKFHYDLLCPGILNSKEIKMSLSEARKAGYKACDKCCYDYLHE